MTRNVTNRQRSLKAAGGVERDLKKLLKTKELDNAERVLLEGILGNIRHLRERISRSRCACMDK